MTEPIDEAAKRLKKNIEKKDIPTTSSQDFSRKTEAGDPECKHCGGLGYIRASHPVGHPEFGKISICVCRKAEVALYDHDQLFSYSQLNELQALTFDNFQPRGRIGLGEHLADSLEAAFNQAKHYASTHDGWLLLRGKFGCGKTHLAAAIANVAVSHGIQTLFITVPDLLDNLRFSYSRTSEASFEERFNEIRQCHLLILDDFGTQNATPWAQEKLFQIVNYRYINKLPLVVTTNLELDQIEGRIRSRLADPDLVTQMQIIATDYRRPMDDLGFHELSTLSLHGDQTFESFSVRKSEGLTSDQVKRLEDVLMAARDYAASPHGWIIFFGSYGSGKTHLAAAIANYQTNLGGQPLFIVVPDLLDHLRATFNPNSTVTLDRRFDEIRTSPLLILDDLGTQSMTPWVKEKLYQLFNYRYTSKLPTVITTSDTADQIDPRIYSRLADTRLCRSYNITAPAYTGRNR